VPKGKPYNPLLKSYPDSIKINSASIGAETLYTRLIAKSDDAGRFWGSPTMLCAKLYALRMERGDVTPDSVAGWLNELETVGLIVRYTVDGRDYLEMSRVYKTLRTDRDAKMKFPPNPCNSEDYNLAVKRQSNDCPTQHNTTQHHTTRRAAGAAPRAARFEEFWQAWGSRKRRRDKAKCRKKWALWRLDEQADVIIEAVKRDRDSQEWLDGFDPAPLTWINGRRWEDDPNDSDNGDLSVDSLGTGRPPTPEELDIVEGAIDRDD